MSIQSTAILLRLYYRISWNYRRGHRKIQVSIQKKTLSSRSSGHLMGMLSLWDTKHMDWLCGVCMADCCVLPVKWTMYLAVTGMCYSS